MISNDKCTPTSTAVTHTNTQSMKFNSIAHIHEKRARGRQKRKERNKKTTFLLFVSVLKTFKKSNLDGNFHIWKDECVGGSKRQPLARTVKTYQSVYSSDDGTKSFPFHSHSD
jgi:hypothetical protein